MEQHHVVPLSLGSNDIDSNKVWLCIKCHNLIHSRSLNCGALATKSPNFLKAVAEHRVGRPPVETSKDFYEAVKLWRSGEIKAVEAYKRAGMKKATFYNVVKRENL